MKHLVTSWFCGLAALVASGCASDRVFECEPGDQTQCRRSGQFGNCLAPGYCAFADSSCSDGLRWDPTAREDLANECVTTDGGQNPGETNDCGGTANLGGIPGMSCGICDSGVLSCDGVDALRCDNEATLEQNITSEGAVSATSIFGNEFQPSNSVDGDLTTAWFSAGPGVDGAESVFTWANTQDRCIKTISFEGTRLTQFPTDFGFAQMVVEVRDASDVLVFSKLEPLTGTPDPAVLVDTGGVVGRSVLLRMQTHESTDCGGFSELIVNGIL